MQLFNDVCFCFPKCCMLGLKAEGAWPCSRAANTLGWVVGSTKLETFTWNVAVHIYSPTNSQYMAKNFPKLKPNRFSFPTNQTL